MARKLKEATAKPFPSPARRPDGHARDWKQAEARRGVAQAVNTVHRDYKFAIRQNSQITLKFS